MTASWLALLVACACPTSRRFPAPGCGARDGRPHRHDPAMSASTSFSLSPIYSTGRAPPLAARDVRLLPPPTTPPSCPVSRARPRPHPAAVIVTPIPGAQHASDMEMPSSHIRKADSSACRRSACRCHRCPDPRCPARLRHGDVKQPYPQG
jgi:hypothetical protein